MRQPPGDADPVDTLAGEQLPAPEIEEFMDMLRDPGDSVYDRARIDPARFFFDRIPPRTAACCPTIKSVRASPMAMAEAAF